MVRLALVVPVVPVAQVAAVTSVRMWAVTTVLAPVDLTLATILTRVLRPPWRPRMGSAVLVMSAVQFAGVFTWGFWSYWDTCYRFALPGAMKPLAPLLGAGVGALGWVLWQIAQRAGRWAIPVFLALGGLESVPGHLNAIYRFGLLERCPLTAGVSPVSALVFGVFEFGFYWAVALALSSLAARLVGTRSAGPPKQRPPASSENDAGGR